MMLSPFTPPGTKVVCIKEPVRLLRGLDDIVHPPGRTIRVGEVYTVVGIVDCGKYFAQLAEFDQLDVFGLHLFRRLDLPKCLTSLLHVQPHDLEVV